MTEENYHGNKKLIFKTSDYDLDECERKAKYKDYDRVSCEKCKQNINPKWLCKNCYKYETEEEKYRMLYGICKACFDPMRIPYWCSYCNSYRFRQDFDKWSSNNKSIDELIQYSQASACNKHILEWIPYEKFSKVELLGKGGFAEVYSATWTDGRIEKWDQESKNWKKSGSLNVALKVLKNSKSFSEDFLNELKFLKKFPSNYYTFVIECYGITQEPESLDYALVLKLKECNLRDYLNKNYSSLTLKDKLYIIERICLALNCIHSHNIIHGDFHPKNILHSIEGNKKSNISICDFGYCKQANENSSKQEDYRVGVMAYMAPEILRGNEYTKASDIYSLGIIINEIISGYQPFNNEDHNHLLALDICHGKHPEISEETPDLLKILILKCLDQDPEKRPDTNQIHAMLQDFIYTKDERGFYNYKEHTKQFKELKDIINGIKITINGTPERNSQVENNENTSTYSKSSRILISSDVKSIQESLSELQI